MALMLILSVVLSGCVWGADPGAAARVATPEAFDLFCQGVSDMSACERRLSGPDVNEFSVAVNPLDGDNAIITANDYGAGDDAGPVQGAAHRLWGSYWVTTDGGHTWTKGTLPGMAPDVESRLFGSSYVGDLVVTFDTKGVAHVAGIGYNGRGPIRDNLLFHARSMDGGVTFREPTPVDSSTTEFAFHDKPAIAVDTDGRIYIAWAFRDGIPPRATMDGQDPGDMRLAFSDDEGETWTARPMTHGDSGISASIAIGPGGSVNIAWRTYDPLGVRFIRSEDRGHTFTEPVLVHEITSASIDVQDSNYRGAILPTLVALPDGTLLMTSGDRSLDHDFDVLVARSIDNGASWNVTGLSSTREHMQMLPTLAASPEGVVVAAWLDKRDDPDNVAHRLYSAISRDGGITWSERAVSTKLGPDPEGDDETAFFIGDYIGSGVQGDQVYYAWPDLRDDGRSRLYALGVGLDDTP